MPAPPSSAVKAANAAAISAAKSSAARSSAPNAAAAAASARMSSGNLGKSTPSGVGNQMGGGNTGGVSKNTSAVRNTVNAAAANANRIASLNQAGPTQTGGGKGNFGGNPSPIQRGLAALGMGSPLPSMTGATAKPNGLAAYDKLRNMVTPYKASPAAIVAGGATPAMSGDFSKTWGFTPEMYQNPATNAVSMLDGGGLYGYPKAPKDQARVPQATSQPTRVSNALTGARDYDPVANFNSGGVSRPVSTAETTARAFSPPLAGNGIPGDPSANRQPVIGEVNPADITGRKAPVKLSDVPPVPVRGQTVRPGINYSSADMAQIYGQYQNPGPGAVAGVPVRDTPNYPRLASDPTIKGRSLAPRTIPASSALAIAQRWPEVGAGTTANLQEYRPQIGGVTMASPAAGNTPLGTPDDLYMGDSTVGQKLAAKTLDYLDKRTAPIRKGGEWVNTMLGGSPYNDLYGRPGMETDYLRNQHNSNASNEQAARLRRKRIADALTGNGNGTGTGTGGNTTLPPWFRWNQWPVGPRPSNV